MPINESKTPRTDAEGLWTTFEDGFFCLEKTSPDKARYVDAKFARTLEIELSTLTEENKKLKEELAANEIRRGNAARGYIEARQQIDQLKSQLAAPQ